MISENPLEQPAPEDVIDRIRVFARDIAYGIVNKIWSSEFGVNKSRGIMLGWRNWGDGSDEFEIYMKRKWSNSQPDDFLMVTFGFLHEISGGHYVPTVRAFQLLEQPAKSPTIFISYGQKQSSELALLIEARLRYVDRQIGIFIDKLIPLGEGWHQHLEDQVKQAEYFVCLLGQEVVGVNADKSLSYNQTIEREAVQKEIQWALELDKKIIFLCHRGYTLPSQQGGISDATWDLIRKLRQKQGIFVDNESSEEYENAINKLLNRLQYPTF